MRLIFSIFLVLSFFSGVSQNIQVNTTTYSPQQLVEDILINSGCIDNIQIGNVVGGNFADGDKSFGYFSQNGSTFPFEKGLVLSTGKLKNVPGPNSTLSDDDAPGWGGDLDLESALGITNTTNATIIEFDFVPNADNIRFRYIFASEEYQEGNSSTCIYSDAFAFLIKPNGGSYTNIALVPGTNTPVLVTTVHSGIPNACPPINETYFEGWNGVNVPINFNGQTKILTAETPVTPNQSYHIKLVIADEENYRYDSTVFLEGESFNISANLGPDRSFVTNNPLCDMETLELDATPIVNSPVGYKWFKNGNPIAGEITAKIIVSEPGIYSVDIDYGSGCIAQDEIVIDYADPVIVADTDLFQCETNISGIATFNLFDADVAITLGDTSLQTFAFYKTRTQAENNQSPIPNPENYTNSQQDEIVFARVVSPYSCFAVAKITLKTTVNNLNAIDLVSCSISGTPGIADFNLLDATNQLIGVYGNLISVSYHTTYEKAISSSEKLNNSFTNTIEGGQRIFGRISGDIGCIGIVPIDLSVLALPEFDSIESIFYCENNFPTIITLSSGLIDPLANVSYFWSTGETTPTIEVNAAGNYDVAVTNTQQINGMDYSCSANNTITVARSSTATATYAVTGNYGDQNVTIITNGNGIYTYSLDSKNGPFQESPIFKDVLGGIHTVYIKDENGCGTTALKVYVLDFPKFFTPNSDGFHDTWQIAGLNESSQQITKVAIYDRFGKLLQILTPNSRGWNGTFNGAQLPSSDYWFEAFFEDGGTYKGHFSLKR